MTRTPTWHHLTRTLLAVCSGCLAAMAASDTGKRDTLEQSFITPAAHSKPWVYWDLMNGNLTHEGLKEDLESMARTGIGWLTSDWDWPDRSNLAVRNGLTR
jgi:hypothetical protein